MHCIAWRRSSKSAAFRSREGGSGSVRGVTEDQSAG